MSVRRTTAFLDYAACVRPEIETALDRYTRYGGDVPAVLREAIRHSLLAPGKRLRPLLVLLAAEACGAERAAALPAACAVEMVHTYSLIHDDLPAMDDDLLRRGLPTCHARFGEAIAILAGDALLTQAFEVLANDVVPAETAAACCRELARSAGGAAMVGGQVDDLAAAGSGGREQLERIHRRKTGALLTASLRIGGWIASASPPQAEALERYGGDLGLAFQIVDDLLDVEGQAGCLGKTVGKDARQAKLTFPRLLGIDESRRVASTLIDRACSALQPLGPGAELLASLARYVLERNR